MKKVIKNLPKRNCNNIKEIEKILNISFTYVDGNTGETHFTDNATGKKWRTPRSGMEYVCSLMDGVEHCYLQNNRHEVNFIPEDYHA